MPHLTHIKLSCLSLSLANASLENLYGKRFLTTWRIDPSIPFQGSIQIPPAPPALPVPPPSPFSNITDAAPSPSLNWPALLGGLLAAAVILIASVTFGVLFYQRRRREQQQSGSHKTVSDGTYSFTSRDHKYNSVVVSTDGGDGGLPKSRSPDTAIAASGRDISSLVMSKNALLSHAQQNSRAGEETETHSHSLDPLPADIAQSLMMAQRRLAHGSTLSLMAGSKASFVLGRESTGLGKPLGFSAESFKVIDASGRKLLQECVHCSAGLSPSPERPPQGRFISSLTTSQIADRAIITGVKPLALVSEEVSEILSGGGESNGPSGRPDSGVSPRGAAWATPVRSVGAHPFLEAGKTTVEASGCMISPWGAALAASALGITEDENPPTPHHPALANELSTQTSAVTSNKAAASRAALMPSPGIGGQNPASAVGKVLTPEAPQAGYGSSIPSAVPMASDLLLPFLPAHSLFDKHISSFSRVSTGQQGGGFLRVSTQMYGPTSNPPPRDDVASSHNALSSPTDSQIHDTVTRNTIAPGLAHQGVSPFAQGPVQAEFAQTNDLGGRPGVSSAAGPSLSTPQQSSSTGTAESLTSTGRLMTGRVATLEPNPDILFELDWARHVIASE